MQALEIKAISESNVLNFFPMKVLYLIDSLEGYGAEKSIVQIAMNLQAITPVFVHLYSGEKLKPALLAAGIKVYSLNLPAENGYRKALKKISAIIENENPQVIHSMLFRADMVARGLKKIHPDILLVGSFVSNSYGKKRYSEMSPLAKIKLFRTQFIDRYTSKNVDYFVCNSKAIMKTNINALGISPDKIEVIYRGRNFKDFSSTSEAIAKLSKELNLNGKKIYLNVGRLLRTKGQLDLLHAFRDLITQDSENVLLLAGEGSLRDELEQKIKKLGLEKNVLLLGYREDIPELLGVSDFFVFPSYYEGLPGALIEAIIAKKPCIVSDIPENRECFETNGALFFPPGDINELTEKLREAGTHTDWRKKVDASFIHADNHFRIKNISKKYESFYKKILTE